MDGQDPKRSNLTIWVSKSDSEDEEQKVRQSRDEKQDLWFSRHTFLDCPSGDVSNHKNNHQGSDLRGLDVWLIGEGHSLRDQSIRICAALI